MPKQVYISASWITPSYKGNTNSLAWGFWRSQNPQYPFALLSYFNHLPQMGFNVTGLVTTPWHCKIMCHSGLGDFWGAGLGKFNSYKRWKKKKKKKKSKFLLILIKLWNTHLSSVFLLPNSIRKSIKHISPLKENWQIYTQGNLAMHLPPQDMCPKGG